MVIAELSKSLKMFQDINDPVTYTVY
uniref:Uncharacterized protein n=1 Tax=Anguilla anguilla TaxID=7936 RepID=A0A0E9UMX9_ANGAN